MSTRSKRRDVATLVGVPLAILVLLAAQWLEGGALRTLLQPTAALVVFGGTLAAILVSYPLRLVGTTARAVLHAVDEPPEPDTLLVSRLAEFGSLARRKGLNALEAQVGSIGEPFLKQALELATDGFHANDVRRLLETDNRTREHQDEEPADLLEAAAGYAPTLGILGAVLGLIHVMENLAEPGQLGSGIAVAFVSTVYGVGAANLILLPLATKVRARARASALAREVIIEAVAAIQHNTHPRLMEQQLAAFLRRRLDERGREVAA
jgi:chemotaxis protein MotA